MTHYNNQKLLIKIENLSININNKLILENINLEIYDKQIITIIGPNGAGKSTLIKAILGLVKPYKGTITIDPTIKIGYMPQKINFPEQIPMNVIKFLLLNNREHPMISVQLAKLAKELSIEHLLKKSIHTLSGGELQRVLFTKALLKQPNLLILDEPTKSIDLNGQAEFYQLCDNIQKRFHCALVMASHDLHVVMSGDNYVICLNKHICCYGLPSMVSKHQEFVRLFGDNIKRLAFYSHNHDHKHDFLDNQNK